MTEEERKMLVDTHNKTNEMHRALMARPATGEPPMYERINTVVRFFERTSWAGKMIIRAFLTLGAVSGAAAAIWAVVSQSGASK